MNILYCKGISCSSLSEPKADFTNGIVFTFNLLNALRLFIFNSNMGFIKVKDNVNICGTNLISRSEIIIGNDVTVD